MRICIILAGWMCIGATSVTAFSDESDEMLLDKMSLDTRLSFHHDENRISLEEDGGQGWYVVPKIGANMISDVSLRINGATVGNVSYDTGLSLGLSLGIDITDSFALELDAGYMKNSIDTVDVLGVFATQVSVDTEQVPVMLNGVWTNRDKNLYFGVGLGATRGETSGSGIIAGVPITITGDPEWGFTYQLMVGMGLDLSYNSYLDLGYRFMHAEYDDSSLNNHIIQLGVSFSF